MPNLTVPISHTAYEILKSLATHSGETLPVVLDKAIESYRRQLFLEDANRAFAMLRSDEAAWGEELEERKAWDCTLADGVAEA